MGGVATLFSGNNQQKGIAAQPVAQDPYQQGLASQKAELALAPEQYAAYQQYAPQYAQTDVQALGQSLFGSGFSGNLSDINQKLTDQSSLQTQQANTSLRNANQADVASLSPQIQAQLRAANPEYYSQLGSQAAKAQQGVGTAYQGNLASLAGSTLFNPVALNQVSAPTVQAGAVGASRVYAPMGNATLSGLTQQFQAQPGLSATQTSADTQAQNLLAQGGHLSDQDLRNVQQSTRAAYAARGLNDSNQAIGTEVLNTDAAQRARLMQNISTAEGVEGQSQGERASQQQFGLGVSAQQQSYGQLGVQTQLANQSAGLQAQIANQGAGLQAQTTNAGYNFNAQNANNANVLAQQQANLAAQNQQYGQYGQLAALSQQTALQNFQMGQQSLGNYAASIFDPQAAVLGQNSTNVGTNSALFGVGAGATANNGAVQNMFNPFSQYSSSLYNANAGNQTQTNIASANNGAKLTGDLLAHDAQVGSSW